jgi:hypothetical protein
MKKKVLAVLLTVAILSSLLVTAAGAVSVGNFTDVKSGSWYYEYVNNVTSKDYMIGVSSTKFAPEDNMTRAMFVTVLARVAGVEVNDSVSTFNDVPANTWYTGAVTWAANNEITYGVGNNNFAPNAFVTRQEMCTFMARFVEYYEKNHSVTHKDNNTVETFADASLIANWATSAINQCREWGLVVGYDNGNFGAYDFATRSQVAAVISRLDWMVNSTTSGNGGKVDEHTVRVTFTLPHDVTVKYSTGEVTGNTFDLIAGNLGDDLDEAVKSLVNDNYDKITSWIEKALNSNYANEFSKTETVTNNGVGYTITVTVYNKVISATVTAPMSALIGNGGGVQTFALTASTEDAQNLINSINNGGTVSLTDLATLKLILDKASVVQDWEQEDLDDAIANKAPDSAKDLVSGLSLDDAKQQVSDYTENVITPITNDLVNTVNTALGNTTEESKLSLADIIEKANTPATDTDEDGNVTETDELSQALSNALGDDFTDLTSVTVTDDVHKDVQESIKTSDLGNATISIDLGRYLDGITDSSEGGRRANTISRLTSYLEKFVPEKSSIKVVDEGNTNGDCIGKLNDAIDSALSVVEKVPARNEDGTIKVDENGDTVYSTDLRIIDDAGKIYNAIKDCVSKLCDAYTTLNGTETTKNATANLTEFYTALLNDLVGKAGGYGIDVSEYTDNIDTIATALATNSICDLSGKSFDATVNAQNLYNKALNYANESENETVSGNIDKLPETVPAKVAGNYTVKIEIDPSAESDN